MAHPRAVCRLASHLLKVQAPRVLPLTTRQTSGQLQLSRRRPSSLAAWHLPACPTIARRGLSAPSATGPEAPDYLSEGEKAIFDKIKAELQPVALEVQDISGGCGSMYALDITSPRFKGLPVVKQHKLVNQVLSENQAMARAAAEDEGALICYCLCYCVVSIPGQLHSSRS